MKNKKETAKKLLTTSEETEVVRDLASGKIYCKGREISETQLQRMQNKKITIDLGSGSKQEIR